MTVKYGEPVRQFNAEEQDVAQSIREFGFEPVVLRADVDRFSCHLRFAREQNKNEDLPPTRYDHSVMEVLRLALAQLEGLEAV